MDIQRIEHGSKGGFIITENNERLAKMTYIIADVSDKAPEFSDVLSK